MQITKHKIESAKQCLETLDDYARMAGINPFGAYLFLSEFIKSVEQLLIDSTKNGK